MLSVPCLGLVMDSESIKTMIKVARNYRLTIGD